MSTSLPEIYLARHGETAWTISRQHTGLTDIPLLRQGEEDAIQLAHRLKGLAFAKVLVSPLGRARRTCELAGFGDKAEVDPELHEWDYGDYEGRRTADIRQERPGWYLFRDGCPGGESIAAIGARADRVIARLRTHRWQCPALQSWAFSPCPRSSLAGAPSGRRPPVRTLYSGAEHPGLRT